MNEQARFEIPSEGAFVDSGGDYLPGDEDIRPVAEKLIERYADFAEIKAAGYTFAYLWKARGGKRNGNAVLGKLQRPTGLLRYFAAVDFVLTISADHCRAVKLTTLGMEALVFHELMHARDGELGPEVRGHDAELFRREVELYGFWRENLRYVSKAFQLQLGRATEGEVVE